MIGSIVRLSGATLLFCSVLVLVPSCSGASPPLSENSQAEIYASVIQQLEKDFGMPSHGYIMTHTDDTAGTASEASNSTTISPSLQNALLSALSARSGTYSWVDTIDGHLDEIMSGAASQIILGGIHVQEDGSVHVTGSLFFGGTGGGGTTYVLKLIGGVWEVTGTTGAMWMS